MRHGYTSLLFSCILILASFSGYAQRYRSVNYDVKDGLAGSVVHAIAQTKDGFIWMATASGLSRFDGVRFKSYAMTDGLPSNEILGLKVDSKNRLWMIPFRNTVCYYAAGKIHNADNDTVLRKVRLRTLAFSIAESEHGDIIVQGKEQTFIISTSGTVTEIPQGNNKVISRITRPYRIAGVNGGLTANMVQLPLKVQQQTGMHWAYLGKVPAPDDTAYILSWADTLYRVTASGARKKLFLGKTSNGFCWLNSRDIVPFRRHGCGARSFDLDSWTFSETYLKDYKIFFAMKDHEGNLWLGTKGNGVFRLSKRSFRDLFTTRGKGSHYVIDIKKIDGRICIGMDDDRYHYCEPVDSAFFTTDRANTIKTFVPDRRFLAHMPAHTLIYCAGFPFPFPPGWLAERELQLSKTVFFKGDTLLLAQTNATYLYTMRDRKLIKIRPGRSTCALQLGDRYYIGTLDGLYETDENAKARFLGQHLPALASPVNIMATGADSTLWIGTSGKGLLGYKNGRVIAAFTQKNGLVSDQCRSLFRLGNTLWVGTDRGLNKVDITPRAYRVLKKITSSDGLGSNLVNAVYADGDFIYAGGPGGITVFNEQEPIAHNAPRLEMTEVIVSGRPIDFRKQPVALPHDDNNISFQYAGISFMDGAEIGYRYRIRGLEEHWQITKDHQLSFPSLPSGSYTLELVACNRFGDKSKPLMFPFQIQKTFTETILFKLSAVLLSIVTVSMLVWYGIRTYHRKAWKRVQTEHKMMTLEQMALQAQMNPHFIFNCLNSIQQYVVDGDTEKTNFYLTSFARLLRETLDNANKITVTVEEEIAYLDKYIRLEQLQSDGMFDYSITVAPEVATRSTKIPNMVLQPYVENAIKHGLSLQPGGLLVIAFSLCNAEGLLVCTVEDNGPGIGQASDANPTHAPRGMSLTSKRIRILNQLGIAGGDIRLMVGTGANNTGTKVTLYFPVHYDKSDHYR